MPLFSHYEPLADISDRLAIPSLVFCVVTPLVVLARFFARCLHGNQLGRDDWTILASLVFALAVNIQMIICCKWGFGKHTKLISPSVLRRTLELYFYAQILYKINIGLTKISILLFYLRVFGIARWFKILCWIVMGIVIAFTTASVTTSIFQCSPVKYAYDKSSGNGTCIDLSKFWYGNAGYNIGTDMIIIIMPVLVIRPLKLPTRTKIALSGVFGLGVFVCVTSIFRFTTLNISTIRTDSMWQSIDSSMWTIIESNLAIIVACMPALRRPIAHFFPALFGKTSAVSGSPRSKTPNYPYPLTKVSHDAEGRRDTEKHTMSKGETWIYDDNDDDDELAPQNSVGRNCAIGEVYDMQEIGESDRGSDVTILKKEGMGGNDSGNNHILKTTEVRVEGEDVTQHPFSKNRNHMPG